MIQTYAPQTSLVYMGLSTDTKPAAGIGSKFIETDTKDVYLYENTGTWVQVGTLGTTAAVSFTI